MVVKHGANKCLGAVNLQFRQWVGSGKVTVSSGMARQLDCLEGDAVEIVGVASPDETAQFAANARGQMLRGMISMMGRGDDY